MATLAEPAERDADKVEKAPAPDGNSHPLIRRDAWSFLPVHPQTRRISPTSLSDLGFDVSVSLSFVDPVRG
jgi:hypothetical protein